MSTNIPEPPPEVVGQVPDITVGSGPITVYGILTIVASGLFALAIGITTALGALPEGVSNRIGATLTAVAAVSAAVAMGIVGFSRVAFAKQKVELAKTLTTPPPLPPE